MDRREIAGRSVLSSPDKPARGRFHRQAGEEHSGRGSFRLTEGMKVETGRVTLPMIGGCG